MDAEALYAQIGHLVETIPDLIARPVLPATGLWLGRAHALISNVASKQDLAKFAGGMDMIMSSSDFVHRRRAMGDIQAVLYRALSAAEMLAPIKSQGAFIPAGNAFDALAAVGKVLGTATISALIVDPYLDEKVLTEFAPMAAENITLKLLSDVQTVKPSFSPALGAWRRQFGTSSRLLEARLAPARSLHDRLIIVDDIQVWILTQSLNALAARAPASLARVETDAAALKIEAYASIWNSATQL
jgi:hypothetical protein